MTWLRSRSPVSWAIGVNHCHQLGPCLSRTGDSPATKFLPSFPGKPWTSSRFLGLKIYTYFIHHPGSSSGSNHWILHVPQLSHVAHELFSKIPRGDPHDLATRLYAPTRQTCLWNSWDVHRALKARVFLEPINRGVGRRKCCYHYHTIKNTCNAKSENDDDASTF